MRNEAEWKKRLSFFMEYLEQHREKAGGFLRDFAALLYMLNETGLDEEDIPVMELWYKKWREACEGNEEFQNRNRRFGKTLETLSADMRNQVQGFLIGLAGETGDQYENTAAVFRFMLQEMFARQIISEFITPMSLCDMMAQMLEPAEGERILDPVCGSGRLLAAAAKYGGSCFLTGNDYREEMRTLAFFNLYFNGKRQAELFCRDFLTDSGSWENSCDVVLANPPYASDLRQTCLFVKNILNSLKAGGRCGILVPDGFLTSTTSRADEMRKTLLYEYCVDGIVSLPQKIYKPYIISNSSFIILSRKPAEEGHRVFMCRMEEWEGKDSDFSAQVYKPQMESIVEAWRRYRKNGDRSGETGGVKFWTASTEEIMKQEGILAVDFYREPDRPRLLNESMAGGETLWDREIVREELSSVFEEIRLFGQEIPLFELNQVARIYSGSNLKNGKKDFGEDGYPWVRVEDLNSCYITDTSKRLSQEAEGKVKISPAQTVFFSSTGTVGKVGISNGLMAPSNNIIAVEFDRKKVIPLYGMYCLKAMEPEFRAASKGSVYDSLRLSVFRQFMIPVPAIEIQDAIAKKLQSINDAERRQRENIEYAKKELVEKFHSQFWESIKRTEGAEGEALQTLGDCAELELNGAAKAGEIEGDRILARYFSTPQLADWEVMWRQLPQEVVDLKHMDRYSLRAGDIVMNRINSSERLGRCGIVSEEPEKFAVFGKNTLRIRAMKEIADPYFLFTWLIHPNVKEYIKRAAKKSTSFQSSLSKTVLMELPVPSAALEEQKEFRKYGEKYFKYVQTAEQIIETLGALRQVWYSKILVMQKQGKNSGEAKSDFSYENRRFWKTPSGTVCFYDSFLECIQIPAAEKGKLRLSNLPLGVEIQFLDGLRGVSDAHYGSLEHIRLCRTGENTIKWIEMFPAAYEEGDRENDQKLEESGLISDQQDFGYIRIVKTRRFKNETAEQFLARESTEMFSGKEPYSRFAKLPPSVRSFLANLSPMQQAVYEEFLLAMQPLASHMVRKQILARGEEKLTEVCRIQDVIAAVQLLENAGLLERKQGFYLDYYSDNKEDDRLPILDSTGNYIAMDTWICVGIEGNE